MKKSQYCIHVFWALLTILPKLSFEMLETLGFEAEERSLRAPCATQVIYMLSSWYQMSFEVNFIKLLGI